jgi:hypothetical protein
LQGEDAKTRNFLIVLAVVVALGLLAVKQTNTKDDDEND